MLLRLVTVVFCAVLIIGIRFLAPSISSITAAPGGLSVRLLAALLLCTIVYRVSVFRPVTTMWILDIACVHHEDPVLLWCKRSIV